MPGEIRIYPEYIDLLRELAREEGVDPEDQKMLFSKFAPLQVPAYRPGSFTLDLHVDDTDFPFTRHVDTHKIYELVGPNERSKTSTLIFLATLLGYDWEANRSFLSDPKVSRQAKIIQDRLSSGLAASLEAQDEAYRVQVQIQDGKATYGLWDRRTKRAEVMPTELPLSSEKDWAEFRRGVAGFADVQVVGVGRNFVTQVGFDESENLTKFCEALARGMAEVMSELGAQKPQYPRHVAQLQHDRSVNKVKELQGRLSDTKQQISALGERLSTLEDLLQKGASLWAEGKLPGTMKLLRDYRLLKELEDGLQAIRSDLSTKTRQASEFDQALAVLKKQVAAVDEVTKNLIRRINQVRPRLPLIQQFVEQILAALGEGRIADAVSLLQQVPVSTDTPKAHTALTNPAVWSGLSQETPMIFLSSLGEPCPTVGAFRNAMKRSTEIAEQHLLLWHTAKDDIQKLVDEGLEKTPSKTGLEGKLETLSGHVTVLRQDITRLEALELERRSRAEAMSTTSRELHERATEAFRNLNSAEQAWVEGIRAQGIPPEDWEFGSRDQIVTLIAQLKMELTTLRDRIDKANSELEITKGDIVKWQIAITDSARAEQLQRRISALGAWQDKARAIVEYFHHRRLHLSFGNEPDRRDYEQAATHLGPTFHQVIGTLNLRIQKRCPFAFINHGGNRGVVKERVKSFDFLTEHREIENVSAQAAEHGGLNSGMTIYGLASKESTAKLGSILLVDEYGDVGVYRPYIYKALQELPHLRLGVFVRVLEDEKAPIDFTAWRPTA